MENLARKIIKMGNFKGRGLNNHSFSIGFYNNYNYREKYNSIKGSICINYLEYNGIVFGKFYCPIEGFSKEDTECCGLEREQYCCSKTEALEFQTRYNEEVNKEKTKQIYTIIALVCVILLFLFLISFSICLFFSCKKRVYQKVNNNKNNNIINRTL
jgi:hypothetical protein